MSTIILMRHANAELASPGMRDFDRPLSKQGISEARSTANLLHTHYLSALNLQINAVFCSPACRTIETLDSLRKIITIDEQLIAYPHDLYAGGEAAYANLVDSMASNRVCLIIGHNPMIENFAFAMAKAGHQDGLHQLKSGFPTAAIAIINFENTGSGGNLQHFFTAD